MAIEVTNIENISDNLKQLFKVGEYNMILEYKTNLRRWVVSIENLVYNRIIAPNTDILAEYNLGFYLYCESDSDLGAATQEAFLSGNGNTLKIIREV